MSNAPAIFGAVKPRNEVLPKSTVAGLAIVPEPTVSNRRPAPNVPVN